MKINLVIAVWGGDRRGGTKDIIYVKKQLDQLQHLKHSLSQVTLIVSTDEDETEEFKTYLDGLKNLGLPIKIHRKENVGLSYGAYSFCFDLYGSEFDYYIFSEDDYYFAQDNFDTRLVELFKAKPNCGYLCSFVSRAGKKTWMGNTNGITSSSVLQKIKAKFGKLPYDSGCNGGSYSEESGQVTFSDAIQACGFRLYDTTIEYKTLHYYWQHNKANLIPGQQRPYNKKALILPFESNTDKTKSHFNRVFEKYKNKHSGREAIVYATGPTLSVYDHIEDDGSRIKVGVNGIALKGISCDYYFCGHVDQRSELYLDKLKDYHVTGEKFGFISLDGVPKGPWLTLSRAKEIGLIPYGLTTDISFGQDISQFCLTNHLIIFSALQFLIYTGVNKIYLVGSDATNLISCDNHGIDTDRNTARIYEVFKRFKAWVQGSCEVVSINPIGLAGLFSDVYRGDISKIKEASSGKKTPHSNYTNIQNKSISDAINGGYQ